MFYSTKESSLKSKRNRFIICFRSAFSYRAPKTHSKITTRIKQICEHWMDCFLSVAIWLSFAGFYHFSYLLFQIL